MDFKHFFSTKTKLPYKELKGSLVTEKKEKIEIVSGIPRFVSSENYAAAFGLQWEIFRQTDLDSYTKKPFSKNVFQKTSFLRISTFGRRPLHITI